MNINSSVTLSSYYSNSRNYNQNRALKYQYQTEINTGHLLLILLCDNLAKNNKSGSILLTKLHSISRQIGQSLRTIQRHLKSIRKTDVNQQHHKKRFTPGQNLYSIEFAPKPIRHTRSHTESQVSISEESIVENAFSDLFAKLHSKNLQLTENEFINP